VNKYDRLFRLKGKIAVVVGGAGLIGKELIKGLSEAGALTILADIDKENSIRVVNTLKRSGLNVFYRNLDITQEKSVSGLIDFINTRYRKVDIWINCAYPKTLHWGNKFEDVSVLDWKKNIDMHLNGYFVCCQLIAEYMKTKRSGSIINLASIYGIVAPDFSIYENTKMTMPAAYSAIKGGIISFTKYLASYYGKFNIRVNCISPGGLHDKQPQTFVKKYIKKTPLRRMARSGDIVGGIIYLASDASKYVTGHNLVIDGGFSII
jgi:NAD(P)-dependent dehydrogenase (short-subunit alcohol dehydrogenase family)